MSMGTRCSSVSAAVGDYTGTRGLRQKFEIKACEARGVRRKYAVATKAEA
jgi:hypothetical protein